MKARQPLTLILVPDDTHRLASLCGQFNEHLHVIERVLDIDIRQRGNQFALYGKRSNAQRAQRVLEELYDDTAHQRELTSNQVQLSLQTTGQQRQRTQHHQSQSRRSQNREEPSVSTKPDTRKVNKTATPANGASANLSSAKSIAPLPLIHSKRAAVKPRGKNQQHYVQAIQKHDISFGVGPAGTGKTYLAVACAIDALTNDKVERLLLVRPAVEAGEKLGFLPGDLAQKIDPYLRPLYDALYEMLGFETVARLMEKQVIEVAPLAYMRGRTLNNAFIILDESQNTTVAQMKMFLTRIGFGSTAVITGDATQIDLPRGTASGLLHACQVLKHVTDISFTHFTSKDVVRHPLVQQIVDAYDDYEEQP